MTPAELYINSEVRLLRQQQHLAFACLVYRNNKPFWSALSHTAAFEMMSRLRQQGYRSIYAPYRALPRQGA